MTKNRSMPQWEPPRLFDPLWLAERGKDYAKHLCRVGKVTWRRMCRRFPWLDTRMPDGERPPVAEALHMLSVALHGAVLPAVLFLFRLLWSRGKYLFPLPTLTAMCGIAIIFNLVTVVTVVSDYLQYTSMTEFYRNEVLGNTELVVLGTPVLAAAGVFGVLIFVAMLMTNLRIRRGLLALRVLMWANLLVLALLWMYGKVYFLELLDADIFTSDALRQASFSGFEHELARSGLATVFALFIIGLGVTRQKMRMPAFFTDESHLHDPFVRRTLSDRTCEWVRVNSHKRGLLKSSYYILVGIGILIIAPMFMGFGCVVDFTPPLGVTNPAGPKVVERKKKKKILVDPNSSVAIDVPNPEDIPDTIAETAKAPHQINTTGVGTGDEEGPLGLPIGFKHGAMRFIRIQHSGPDWDDGMAESESAINNMLKKFQHFTKVKVQMVSSDDVHRASLLAKYSEGRNPPFVYITGTGSVGMSSADREALREYCLNQGGTIFADSAGSGFGPGFSALLKQIFPEHQIKSISREDDVFRCVKDFTNGYPVLWEHTGRKIQGISSQGRWIVIWYPGELNDAWRNGHMGLSPQKAEEAYAMGANIMAYAFRNWALHAMALQGFSVKKKTHKANVPSDVN